MVKTTKTNENRTFHEVMETRASKLTAATLIGLGAFSLAGCATQAVAAPKPSVAPKPTNTKEAAPVISAQSVEIKDTTPVSQLGQVVLGDRLTAWVMGGADKASEQEYLEGNLDYVAQAKVIADPIDKVFVQNMFTQNALNDPATKKYIQDTENDHVDRLGFYLITANDPIVYNWYTTVGKETIIPSSGSDFEINVSDTEHNNVTPDDKIGSKYGPTELQNNGSTGVFDIKLVDTDGLYKIDSITNVTASTSQG